MNLLPTNKKRAIKKEYHLHMFVVALGLLAMLLLISIMLFVPALIASWSKLATVKNDAHAYERSNVTDQTDDFLSEIEKMKNDLDRVASYKTDDERAVTAIIDSIIAEKDALSLTGFFYNKGGDGAENILVNGFANDRDELVAFRDRLSDSGIFTTVDLPVADLVSEKDIDFSIKLSLSKENGT